MVATLVFILGKSPYEDQNGKNGPYLVFILDFSPHFEEIEKWTANLIKLFVGDACLFPCWPIA